MFKQNAPFKALKSLVRAFSLTPLKVLNTNSSLVGKSLMRAPYNALMVIQRQFIMGGGLICPFPLQIFFIKIVKICVVLRFKETPLKLSFCLYKLPILCFSLTLKQNTPFNALKSIMRALNLIPLKVLKQKRLSCRQIVFVLVVQRALAFLASFLYVRQFYCPLFRRSLLTYNN